MAVITDTLEGVIDEVFWFHYDIMSDVLYLRLADERQTETLGDESTDGTILLRAEEDDRLVGLTVVNWWKRFGNGSLPDSLRSLEQLIEPWGRRLSA